MSLRRSLLLAGLGTLLLPWPTFASGHRMDFGGGGGGGDTENASKSWGGYVAVGIPLKVHHPVALVFEGNLIRGEHDLRQHGGMGGIRVGATDRSDHRRKWIPFAQVLAGAAHQEVTNQETGQRSEQTGAVWSLGGGVEYVVKHEFTIRGQADWTHSLQSNIKRGIRVTLGAVYRVPQKDKKPTP